MVNFRKTTAIWNVWPQRIAFFINLCFSLAAPNLQITVLCLTSNVSVNWWSDFLAMVFLLDTDGLGVIRMLSVHPSGFETSDASIDTSYFCRSSHLPTVLYNFLMFSKHLCPYKALLPNYWWTPMANMCFPSCLECNILLIITHCSSELWLMLLF